MTNPRFQENSVTEDDFKETLRKREMDCLCLKCDGKTNREIGFSLSISENVVRNYITSIFNKTGIRNAVLLCQAYSIAQGRTRWDQRERKKGRVSSDITLYDGDASEKYHTVVVSR